MNGKKLSVGDKIKNTWVSTVKAPADSLNQLALIEQAKNEENTSRLKTIQDSLIAQNVQDSLLNEAQIITQHDLIKDQNKFSTGPVSTVYLNEENIETLGEEIHDINAKRVSLLANTNIDEKYSQYQNIITEINNIHSPYEVDMEVGFFGASTPVYPTDSKYWGPNRYDLIWPLKNVRDHAESGKPWNLWDKKGHTFLDKDRFQMSPALFNNLTKARLIVNNPEIKKLIEGEYGIGENGSVTKISTGIVDYMHKYNLGDESAEWVNFKERFSYRSNILTIIDYAVEAKLKGKDYFLNPHLSVKRKDSAPSLYHPGTNFMANLSALTGGEQAIVLSTLQNMVNDLTSKGEEIGEKADVLLTEYHRFNEMFPKRKGPYSSLQTPYKNEDLVKSKELDNDLNQTMSAFKYYTGGDFDLVQSFDRISLDSLGTSLDKIPDLDKTLGGQQLLIFLAEELRGKNNQQNQ